MNNFWTTVAHTAGRRIKSKAFVFSSLSMAILIIALTNINSIIDTFSSDSEQQIETIAVVDNTDNEQFSTMLASFEEGNFQYIEYENDDVTAAVEDARNDEFTYVLSLSGKANSLDAEFFGNGTDFSVGNHVNQDVQRVKEAIVTNELGLNEQELALIYSPISFTESPLNEGGEVQTVESHMQAYWMVYALVFAIYLIVITFGTMIATEVATEKSSRVMELIVSSINPVTQMLGKIIGIGFAGLANLLIIIAAAIIGSQMSGDDLISILFSETIDFTLIAYALLLIVLGYFVYGGVAAMLGALVSRAEEVNQALQPLIFVAMIAFFIAIFGLNTPDTTFIQVLSYVPFFTPQLLFLRIGMGTIPVWEIALIISILAISAILLNILAARIYKGGVLMYGKFSFKAGIKQAFSMSKKEK
ncbi:ABC transporter permease [Evansella cellulosilytica]|uniref:Na+ efflux ABC transporter permease n=1 Tax=Evansella cellulosilytica (strain ATCC 21833 / DSM 2522 / FERM P-1141 / JCM 9156 / N-4) TaxID=649639 RepID=E6TQK8_EVAC2|nr:ABC transporter permease [Evansella cellulosilytica]ADU30519.1 Na+ efflux ABC transporter permease [Evansella cellulosilytica DSM 2522]